MEILLNGGGFVAAVVLKPKPHEIRWWNNNSGILKIQVIIPCLTQAGTREQR